MKPNDFETLAMLISDLVEGDPEECSPRLLVQMHLASCDERFAPRAAQFLRGIINPSVLSL